MAKADSIMILLNDDTPFEEQLPPVTDYEVGHVIEMVIKDSNGETVKSICWTLVEQEIGGGIVMREWHSYPPPAD